jgi:hypothetical protein
MRALAIAGFVLMILAALLFVAGSPTMDLLPRNYANFSGIAVACAGVLAWVIYGATRQPDAEETEDEAKR